MLSQTNTKIPKRLKEKCELKNNIKSIKHAEKDQVKQSLQTVVSGSGGFRKGFLFKIVDWICQMITY